MTRVAPYPFAIHRTVQHRAERWRLSGAGNVRLPEGRRTAAWADRACSAYAPARADEPGRDIASLPPGAHLGRLVTQMVHEVRRRNSVGATSASIGALFTPPSVCESVKEFEYLRPEECELFDRFAEIKSMLVWGGIVLCAVIAVRHLRRLSQVHRLLDRWFDRRMTALCQGGPPAQIPRRWLLALALLQMGEGRQLARFAVLDATMRLHDVRGKRAAARRCRRTAFLLRRQGDRNRASLFALLAECLQYAAGMKKANPARAALEFRMAFSQPAIHAADLLDQILQRDLQQPLAKTPWAFLPGLLANPPDPDAENAIPMPPARGRIAEQARTCYSQHGREATARFLCYAVEHHAVGDDELPRCLAALADCLPPERSGPLTPQERRLTGRLYDALAHGWERAGDAVRAGRFRRQAAQVRWG